VFLNAQETPLRKQRKGGLPARLSTWLVPVSLLNEREQIGIDLVRMRGRHPVRQSRVRLQRVVFKSLTDLGANSGQDGKSAKNQLAEEFYDRKMEVVSGY
jgi:hypothetical protein